MSQPEHLAKVHAPEVAAKRGAKRSAWLRSGNPRAVAELARVAAMNPCESPEVRTKISATLKAMGHRPSIRGGNGRGMTVPQSMMKEVLGDGWTDEFALSLGQKTEGYPTNYKLDLAHPGLKIAIEVDGLSHGSRRELDAKKDAKVAEFGWTVLRFTNQEIVAWINGDLNDDHRIARELTRYGIAYGGRP